MSRATCVTYRLLCLFLLIGVPASADSISTADKRTFHGTLKTMDSVVAVVEALFPSGFEVLYIPTATLTRIQFNKVVRNTGSPPESLSVRPPTGAPAGKPPAAPQAKTGDAVFLFGNSMHNCRVLSIDSQHVVCDLQNVFPRSRVNTITFANQE
jgi:hypothetical protein